MPYLAPAVGLRLTWVPLRRSQILGIGSTLESVGRVKSPATVWSSGFMFAKSRKNLSRCRVLAVRGRHTLERIKGINPSKVVLGDGGLLAADAYRHKHGKDPDKKYKLGIVPHYVDKVWIQKYISWLSSPEVLVINVFDPVDMVLGSIASCECIISSSLHGLITADSFGIPNKRFTCPSSTKIGGSGFKYKDYYSAFGIEEPTPISLSPSTSWQECVSWCQSYNRPHLQDIKIRLKHSFKLLKTPFRPSGTKSTAKKANVVTRISKRLVKRKPTVVKRKRIPNPQEDES
jgi:pyruvyltransferase